MTLDYNTELFINHKDDGDHKNLPLYYYLFTPTIEKKSIPPKALFLSLHGAGGDHQQFTDMIPILIKSHYDVMTCDLRYHGKSQLNQDDSHHDDDNEVDMNFNLLVKDLDGALTWYYQKQSKNQRKENDDSPISIILCGLSMGGMLAQYYCHHLLNHQALKQQFIVTTLVPIGCACISITDPIIPWFTFYRHATFNDTKPLLPMAKRSILDSAHTDGAKKLAQLAMDQVTDYHLYCSFRACANVPRVSIDYHHHFINVLLLRGELDQHTSEVMNAWYSDIKMKSSSPSIKFNYQLIPFANHLTTLDAGSTVAEKIVQFLSL
ncbi:unnamed protein product [Cunninghamella blakesleeana]